MLRTMLARALLAYFCHFPVQRGKVRLSRWLDPLTRGAPMRTRLGPLMAARLSDSTFWLLMDEYQPFIDATLSGVRAGDVFIDVGANSGLFSLVAALRVGPTGSVFAFEPSLREYFELTRNLRLNPKEAVRIFPYRLALGDVDESGCLYLAREEMSGLNSRSRSDGGDGSTERIVALRFDSLGLGAVIGARQRVFIKIDTEGSELQILRGMCEFIRSHDVRRIVVEMNDILLGRLGGSRQEVYELMAGLGFVGTVADIKQHYDEVFVPAAIAATGPA